MPRRILILIAIVIGVMLAQWQTRHSSRERRAPAGDRAVTAAPSTTWGQARTLEDHYQRHGADFRAASPEDYAAQAAAFRTRAMRGGLSMKLDEEGVLRIFDPMTGAFGAYNRNGTTRTYFKPGSRDYFARQPGRNVRPEEVR